MIDAGLSAALAGQWRDHTGLGRDPRQWARDTVRASILSSTRGPHRSGEVAFVASVAAEKIYAGLRKALACCSFMPAADCHRTESTRPDCAQGRDAQHYQPDTAQLSGGQPLVEEHVRANSRKSR